MIRYLPRDDAPADGPLMLRHRSGSPHARFPRDEVTVTAFTNGWCPASNIVYERARRAAEAMGERVTFVSIDLRDKADLVHHGHTDEVFIDGKPIQTGPPPSYEKITKKIERRLHRLERS
jgi:hypothetical protein